MSDRDDLWLIPARRDLLDVLRENPPPPRMRGERSPLDALLELRAGER